MGVDEHGLGMVPSLGVGACSEKQLHAQKCRVCTSNRREVVVQFSARIHCQNSINGAEPFQITELIALLWCLFLPDTHGKIFFP